MTLLGYSRQVAAYLAYWYIGLASVLYAMILLVGVTTVVCTTVLASDTQQHTVFALAMAQTVLLLAVKFYNPTARGNQLHASAATLESIIWLFRTRVGAFAVPQNQPSQATAALRAAMTSWHSEAVTGTDLLQTSLERKYPPGVYTHCQFEGTLGEAADGVTSKLNDIKADVKRKWNDIKRHPNAAAPAAAAAAPPARTSPAAAHGAPAAAAAPTAGAAGATAVNRQPKDSEDSWIAGDIETGAVEATDKAMLKELQARRAAELEEATIINDHQSPVPPALYVKMRLLVMRELYQLKIPRCYAWRRFWELVLTCCTVASATLSYLDSTSHYVAVSSSVAAAVTSWLSHVELSRRIERYSNTVRSINDLLWWWESIDDVERANTMNITKLIETGESVLATERLTWIAAARKNDEAAKDSDEDQ